MTDQEIVEYLKTIDFQKIYKKIKRASSDGRINVVDLYCHVFRHEFNACKYLVDEIVGVMVQLKMLAKDQGDYVLCADN